MERPALDAYVMIQANGETIGGLRRVESLPKAPDVSGPILYFTVDELTPTVQRARELGATLVGQAVDLGHDRGRYQWIRDREGNVIGLWAKS